MRLHSLLRFVRRAAPAGVVLTTLSMACGGRPQTPDTAAAEAAGATASAGATSLANAPDRFLEREGVTIRYRVIGPDSGTPLLLLHGYTDRLEMWNGTADSLARNHRVIVPDWRGFGRSVPTDSTVPYGHAMVDDQFALLDTLGIRQVHVVGYSGGGLISANMALRDPSRIASATFVAGAFFEDSAETARILKPYIAALDTEQGLIPFFRYILPSWPDSVLVPAARQYFADNDRRALVRSAMAFSSLALDWSKVRQLTVPAVVVVGTNDAILDLSQRMASRWPGVRYLEAEGSDHIDITLAPRTLEAVRMAVAMATPRMGHVTHAAPASGR
jgi:pimeloyl-ACP methyl ester carboxylesterase